MHEDKPRNRPKELLESTIRRWIDRDEHLLYPRWRATNELEAEAFVSASGHSAENMHDHDSLTSSDDIVVEVGRSRVAVPVHISQRYGWLCNSRDKMIKCRFKGLPVKLAVAPRSVFSVLDPFASYPSNGSGKVPDISRGECERIGIGRYALRNTPTIGSDNSGPGPERFDHRVWAGLFPDRRDHDNIGCGHGSQRAG
jgi:hypothetical protein